MQFRLICLKRVTEPSNISGIEVENYTKKLIFTPKSSALLQLQLTVNDTLYYGLHTMHKDK
jgi:hypothetical protein